MLYKSYVGAPAGVTQKTNRRRTVTQETGVSGVSCFVLVQ